jgi:hypothetical protein
MLWNLASEWKKKNRVPGLIRLQIFIFILASPLWAAAAYQARRPSYIEINLLTQISQFLQFGFLFEPDHYAPAPSTLPAVATICLILLSLFLLVMGLQAKNHQEYRAGVTERPSAWSMTAAASLAFISIILFAKFAHAKDPSRTKLILATSLVPVLLLLINLLLKPYWERVQRVGLLITERLPLRNHLNSICLLLGIFPAAMIAVLSLFSPLFIARALLLYVPFFLIVLSKGLVFLVRRKSVWVALVVIVLGVHGFGVVHWKHRLHSARDYKALAEQWIPKIEESDLIFVRRHWAITPIFYYVSADRFRFIGSNYSEEIQKHPESRIWTFSLPGLPMKKEMIDALKGYEIQERIDAFNIGTVLHMPERGYAF